MGVWRPQLSWSILYGLSSVRMSGTCQQAIAQGIEHAESWKTSIYQLALTACAWWAIFQELQTEIGLCNINICQCYTCSAGVVANQHCCGLPLHKAMLSMQYYNEAYAIPYFSEEHVMGIEPRCCQLTPYPKGICMACTDRIAVVILDDSKLVLVL
jgi:hypothetical protein